MLRPHLAFLATSRRSRRRLPHLTQSPRTHAGHTRCFISVSSPSAQATKPESIREMYDSKSLPWGAAPEARNFADAWLDSRNRRFGLFINNEWLFPENRNLGESFAPATGEVLAHTVQATNEDVDLAVSAAQEAFGPWSSMSPHARARHLYSVARHLQKHHRLLAVLESLDNGKTIRETRDADVPLAIRHFYSHAGWAQLLGSEFRDFMPVGICGQIIPWNFPLLMLAW